MKEDAKKRIVITGMGIISPIGIGKEPFLESILDGKSGIRKISSFDPSNSPSKIAGEIPEFDATEYISKRIPRGRSVQFSVSASKMAVADAGLSVEAIDKERVGVIIGSSSSGIGYIDAEHDRFRDKGRVTPYATISIFAGALSSEVAIHLDLRGYCSTLSNGCTAALDALGMAAGLIKQGAMDVAIAGGAEAPISPFMQSGFCSLRAVSTSNDSPERISRPFDAKRSGMVISEGAGVFILEKLERAVQRKAHIYGEILSYASTNDAFHMAHPRESGVELVRAMNMALQDADLPLEAVDCINAHGTSTILNDKVETAAIKEVFGNRAYRIPVCAIKSMTGHGIAASGGIELAASLLSMERGMIPPTINQEHFDPECDLDYVPNQARSQQVDILLKNSLGFGGRNSCMVFSRFLE